jgi:RNA polymerase primary sigma factor
MSDRIEDTIKSLIEEGRRKGFLTYVEMNALLEDQFVPPDRMDQVFLSLEEAGVEVVDDTDAAGDDSAVADEDAEDLPIPESDNVAEEEDEAPEPVFTRGVLPEKIDDPVWMYLTQMGEKIGRAHV